MESFIRCGSSSIFPKNIPIRLINKSPCPRASKLISLLNSYRGNVINNSAKYAVETGFS